MSKARALRRPIKLVHWEGENAKSHSNYEVFFFKSLGSLNGKHGWDLLGTNRPSSYGIYYTRYCM